MKNILLDNDAAWKRNPYTVRFGESFKTYKEVIEYSIKSDMENMSAADKKLAQEMIDNLDGTEVTKPSLNDTSLGGNDAINCYWQFGIDDDIVHPLNETPNGGMGRVYSEMYEANQQILWMAMGVPQYSSMLDFHADAADGDTAEYMRTGDLYSVKRLLINIGDLVGSGVKLAFKIPFAPILGAAWAYDKIANMENVKLTDYYSFKPTPVLYYRLVNVILSHLAVGMNIYGNADSNVSKNAGGIPKALRDGPDIFRIMFRKNQNRMNRKVTTDDLVKDQKQKPKDRGYASYVETSDSTSWFSNMSYSATGGTDFVGFRIEKSTDSTETFSSTSGPSSLAGKLNGKAQEAADKKFAMAGGSTGIKILDAATQGIKGVLSGVADGLGAGAVTQILSGNGYYNIPEVWKSSSFSKSYSFEINLRSRYGDNLSIYQSVYVPLAMLLAAALPRSIGKSMYTSPFLVQAYCKGMFAIPCGLIENITIKRGLSEFGWNNNKLPTAVSVSMTIKDLSPAMFIGLEGSSALNPLKNLTDAFSGNTSFHEYMTTLSGIGLAERVFGTARIKRRAQAALMINRNTTFNPYYWSNSIGHSTLPRLFGNMFGTWDISNN